jgi:cytochrome b subunit of formate dehydrogenase
MSSDTGKMLRHAAIDRAFHWITAATMTVLLATSLLPIVGVRFAWLEIHWIAGVLLTLAIVLHLVRVLFVQGLRTMRLRRSDFAQLRGEATAGKYSLQQKAIHLAWTVAVLLGIATGWVLMVKAGVPFFDRDPYVLSLRSWGLLTVLHDLAALLSVFLILVHVYFGLLPEKRAYLRSMLQGRIGRDEMGPEHDAAKVARGE